MTAIKVNDVVYRWNDYLGYFVNDTRERISYAELAELVRDRKIEYVEPVKVVKCGESLYRVLSNGVFMCKLYDTDYDWLPLRGSANSIVYDLLSGKAEIIEIYE